MRSLRRGPNVLPRFNVKRKTLPVRWVGCCVACGLLSPTWCPAWVLCLDTTPGAVGDAHCLSPSPPPGPVLTGSEVLSVPLGCWVKGRARQCSQQDGRAVWGTLPPLTAGRTNFTLEGERSSLGGNAAQCFTFQCDLQKEVFLPNSFDGTHYITQLIIATLKTLEGKLRKSLP